MIIDFRHNTERKAGGILYMVNTSKLRSLRNILKLCLIVKFGINVESIVKRGRQRNLLMEKPNSFNVSETILK